MCHLFNFICTLFLVVALPSHTFAESDHAHHNHADRPDAHAPIGVMGDHVHASGEVMFSYRYMHMDMGGNRVGTQSISIADTLTQFPVTPLSMSMDMHMFGAMYASTDGITLMAMVPYIEKSMDHRTRMGGEFTTRGEGIGDVKLMGLITLVAGANHRIHLNAGLSLPTGSIRERDITPVNTDAQLPYPMQIGSGTYDLMPGITYTGSSERLFWGAQASAIIRLGHNSRDYRLGDQYQVTTWLAVPLADWLSLSGRAVYEHIGNIDCADSELNRLMVQTADPALQGGDRIDLAVGFNILFVDGALKGTRLAVEAVIPVYQRLDGPQMERNWGIIAGVQKAF
ncbi:MAG: transporter [Proteobacteria bacterium]|nr:transporter [Pseudomonadota bacterium]